MNSKRKWALRVMVVTSEQPLEFPNLLQQPTVTIKYEVQDNSIIVDDEDVFQCGKCRNKFTFSEFVLHKKNNCSGLRSNSSGQEGEGELSYRFEETPSDAVVGSNATSLQPLVIDDEGILSLVKNDSLDSDPLQESIHQLSDVGFSQTLGSDDVEGLKSYDLIDGAFEVNSILEDHFLIEEDKAIISPDNNASELDFDLKEQVAVKDVIEDVSCPKTEKEVKVKRSHKLNVVQQIKCSFCGKEFRKNFDLKQHERSHTGERPFLCVVCGRAFTQKSNVSKHMSTHKVWPSKTRTIPENPFESIVFVDTGMKLAREIANDKSFVCQYCERVMESYLEWKSHMKTHRNVKVYKCVQGSCSLTFSDTDSFLAHTESHYGQAVYYCHICQEEFRSLDELGLHQYSHSSNPKECAKKSTCSKCGIKYFNEDNHKCNTYTCPKCGREFYSERFLRRHLPLHNSVAVYSCSDCDKAFRTPKYLAMHRVIHSNERSFICQICSASFNRRDRLVRHQLTHEVTKRFKCPYLNTLGCGREFNRKDKLKQHVLTHESAKPVKKSSPIYLSIELNQN